MPLHCWFTVPFRRAARGTGRKSQPGLDSSVIQMQRDSAAVLPVERMELFLEAGTASSCRDVGSLTVTFLE